jgi:ABC-type antimicrobial peptide transport system permease subunit
MVRKVDDSMIQDSLVAQLSTFFGLLAVFLACIGLYGLMSYMVARRTSEIGVRMALGAGRRNVLWMVMKEVLTLTGIGLVVGIPVALAGDRLIASMLFGLKPTDPLAMGGAVVLMLVVAALAGYLPARQAAHVNPMEALRYE